MHEEISETHIVGADTHQQIVRADECPALVKRQILHVGVGDAAPPYRIVRTKLSGAYLHACIGGMGQMLLEGRWRPHREGVVSLSPAHVLHAFHAVSGHRWQYCWVRYMSSSPRSAPGGIAPLMAKFDARPLAAAITGLHAEMQAGGDAGSTTLWADLIEHYVTSFADPLQSEDRLRTVWGSVQEDLAHPWTLHHLAEMAHMSSEHLRRLCQKCLGRSPMQQLTFLRMQHAAQLLATSDRKVEDIANAVGYQNPFAFSNTFKRMTGFRPSQLQVHRRG